MSATSETITVLHVDDEPDFTDLAATFLEREDDRLDVRTADSPDEALSTLADADVDCIVSDYDMPRTNGIELLETVRERHADVPFILYTGKGSEEVAADAISAGVTDYLQKETGTDQYAILANRIRNAVEQRRAERDREQMRERMELALEHTDSVIFEMDLETGTVIRHGTYREFFDLAADEAPTWEGHLERAVHPADQDRFREFYGAILDGDRDSGTFEYRTHPDHGRVRWIRDTVSVEAGPETESGQAVGIARDITAYKDREAELREKERRYQAVFNDPNILVGLLDTDGTVLDINETAMAYVDEDVDELVGEPFWETPWFDHDASVRQSVREWVDRAVGGEYVEFEADLVTPDGDEYVVEGVFRPVTDQSGDVVSILVSDRDVSDQRHHERELQRTKRRLEAIFDNTFSFVGLLDPDGTVLEANRAALTLGDLERSEVVGEVLWETPWFSEDPSASETAKQAVERAREGDLFREEIELTGPEGTIVVDFSVRPVTDDGEVTLLIPEGRDITEKKAYELQLQEERQFVQSIFQSIPDPIVTFSSEGRPLRWNQEFERVTGYDPSEIEDLSPADFVPAADVPTVEAHMRTIRQERRPVTFEAAVETADGEEIPYEFSGGPIEDADGNLRGLTAIGRTIADRKERERQLERTRDLLEQSERIAAVGGWELDPDTMDVFWTENLFELLGLGDLEAEPPLEEALEVYHEDDREVVAEAIDHSLETGEPFDVEVRFRLPDGEVRWLRVQGTPTTASDGSVRTLRGAVQDVTERVEYERTLERQNERLETLAGVVSHDLRNPLSVAQGRLELAREDPSTEHFEAIEQSLDRMQTLIEDLLALAREGETTTEVEPVDLASVVEGCWATVETGAATLECPVDATIRADHSRLKQLFENLFRNAVEHGSATPPPSTNREAIDENAAEDITVTVGALPDGFYVEDDGTGIPESEREDVFEAGYSTSETGTGFGLRIVQEVAEDHDWSVRVVDAEAGGARFEITGVEVERE